MRTFAIPSLPLLLLACSNPLEFADAFAFRGTASHASPRQDTVVVTVTAINVSLETRTIGESNCPPLIDVHAYPSREIRDAPSWRYRNYWATRYLCVAGGPIHQTAEVAPGDSVTYSIRVSVGSVLGDSLPSGIYHFTAELENLAPYVRSDPVELDVGSLLLEDEQE